MGNREEFDAAAGSVVEPARRIAIVGALLGRTVGEEIVIVGGSAIAIYTSGHYLSQDIDVVGPKGRILSTLRTWGFRRDDQGERPYWIRPDLNLMIDVVRSRYSGFHEHIRTLETPFGPVRVAAPEDLIVRRLTFAKHGQQAAMEEAELLLDQFADALDYEYLRAQARYEKATDTLDELFLRVGKPTDVLLPFLSYPPGGADSECGRATTTVRPPQVPVGGSERH